MQSLTCFPEVINSTRIGGFTVILNIIYYKSLHSKSQELDNCHLTVSLNLAPVSWSAIQEALIYTVDIAQDYLTFGTLIAIDNHDLNAWD